MTVPFAQIPVGLANDGRVAALPSGAETLLYRLYLRAATCTEHRDRIPLQRGVAYATAVRFIVGEDTSRLDAIIREGLAVIEGDYLRLTVTVASLSSEAPAARATNHVEAPRGAVPEGVVPGKPSLSKAAQRARNDRAKFTARSSPFKSIDPVETWESWLGSSGGAAFLTEREVAFPGYRAWVTPKVTPQSAVRNTPGNTQVTPQGNTPLKTTSSSENSEERERRERREGESKGKVTPPSNTKGNTPGNAGGGVTGHDLLDALRKAAGTHATLKATAALEAECARMLASLSLTPSEIRAMGEALARPADWFPTGRKPPPAHCTLPDLAGYRSGDAYEWKPLLALVAYVRGRAKATAPSPLLPTVPDDPAAAAAQMRALNAQVIAARTAPTQAPTAPETPHG